VNFRLRERTSDEEKLCGDRTNTGRSDVDILVEFDPSVAASFTNFLNLKESLEALFRRSVDLVELRAIRSRRLRR
jgi:predicted nucleotidyltransferase